MLSKYRYPRFLNSQTFILNYRVIKGYFAMKVLLYMIIIPILTLAFILPNEKKSNLKQDIQGSWELVSFVDHQNKGKDWEEYGPAIIYQKHITENHFSWFKYDSENLRLLGMGGGSYEINDEGKYVEFIEFFYPPGSSELGQAIPFYVKFNEGKWYHTGKAKIMEIGEDGQMKVAGYNKIEEIWSPIMPASKNDDELIGTWDLESYREREGGPFLEYPNFTGYMKLITPSHFMWIKYDREGDQIFSAASGPYQYQNGKYIETIGMIYPPSKNQINSKVIFKPIVSSHKWEHIGKMAPEEKGGDSLLIDEVWIPHQCDPETEFFDY